MSLRFEINGREIPIRVDREGDHAFRVQVNGSVRQVDLRRTPAGSLSLLVDGRTYDVYLEETEDGLQVLVRGEAIPVRIHDPRRELGAGGGLHGPAGRAEITAPMPGKVVAVLVEAGQAVRRGQGVVVVEAMKMENELVSPKDGRVVEIRVRPGQPVESKTPLLVVE